MKLRLSSQHRAETNHSDEKDNNPKHHKDQENNYQCNYFTRINLTKPSMY
jgi:hypothetical protein